MALQIALLADDTLVGTDCPESYVKIEFVRTPAPNNLIWVNWYADAQARADLKQPVKNKEFTLSMVDTQAFVQAGDHLHAPFYRWLKTLPEFAGAVDVFVTPEPSVTPVGAELTNLPALIEAAPAPTQPADGSVN